MYILRYTFIAPVPQSLYNKTCYARVFAAGTVHEMFTRQWLPRLMLFFGLCLTVLFYCEYLIYYVVLLQCRWPMLDKSSSETTQPLRVIFLADPHLLGHRTGHWFDKLRREWQMYRTFQTAMTLFKPEMVFFLGDLFDEGQWAENTEFKQYVNRFHELFYHPKDTVVYAAMGNHDVGFHHLMDEYQLNRFKDHFETSSVRMVRQNDNIFILINSMALEGDGCDLCKQAENEIQNIAKLLKCAKGPKGRKICDQIEKMPYTQPIILQHFPLYRKNDKNCTGPDSASEEVKSVTFQPRWDCLSKNSTHLLLNSLSPRLVLSGHSHNFCEVRHPVHNVHKAVTDTQTLEWTLASFSWRNNKNPSFVLGAISNGDFKLNKCLMPRELTVIWTYIISAVTLLLWLFYPMSKAFTRWRRKGVKDS